MDPESVSKSGLGRRDILFSGGALLVAASVAGCDLLSTNPGSKQGSKKVAGAKGKEAPMLSDAVKAGELPSLRDRLPESPLVMRPVDRIGVYGGEWNGLLTSSADVGHMYLEILNDKLVTWDLTTKPPTPVPNIAESVEMEDGGRSYTINLRRGMRWSDGEQFTADDLVFAYDDVARNEELSGGAVPVILTVSRQLPATGEPPRLEKVDKYTARFIFSEPYGLLLDVLATPFSVELVRPRHYLEQFHKKYNKNVDDLAKKELNADWPSLFWAKADATVNIDLPTVNAWRVTTALGNGTRLRAERNPYYWKVDPDGSQLPYIDRVAYDVLGNPETTLLKTSNGEADLDMWRTVTPRNKPVLARGRTRGYRFVDSRYSSANLDVLSLNLTHEDPKLREVFQSKEFRIGLSHAINRQEIIDAVFQRQGEPWQVAPRPESALFNDDVAELGNQYTEFDVTLANRYLDRAGFGERDSGGFRLRSDGKRISFVIDVVVPDPEGSAWSDVAEFVVRNWRNVGIDVQMNTLDRTLFYTRKEANKHDASIWLDSQGMDESVFDPRWYFPANSESNYALLWANWLNGAEPAEEPPEAPRRQMELYNQLKATADATERMALFRQILQIAKEEFYVIGIVLPPMQYGIVTNDLHNIPEPLMRSWIYAWSGPNQPAQYFLDT